ncbi:MAG: GNAT family N-acetyltransferase [Thermoanaerobaculia bacterium]
MEAVLRDGRRVLIRLFTEKDCEALYRFFHSLPTEVRRFAWENIDDPEVVAGWGRHLDYSKVLPLLAWDGNRIVADATLHRRDRGPLRLAGRIKWLIDPAYRGAGLGTALVNTFMSIAREQGLRHLTCLLAADLEADAVTTLSGLGFTQELYQAYGVDAEGGSHDMVRLALRL